MRDGQKTEIQRRNGRTPEPWREGSRRHYRDYLIGLHGIGNYSDVASTTQQLMAIVECGANYEHLNAEQKTSLFMICNKIARAVNGDPQYFDNYRDIAGYATLAERACESVRGES